MQNCIQRRSPEESPVSRRVRAGRVTHRVLLRKPVRLQPEPPGIVVDRLVPRRK
jgi:hypothetical protein